MDEAVDGCFSHIIIPICPVGYVGIQIDPTRNKIIRIPRKRDFLVRMTYWIHNRYICTNIELEKEEEERRHTIQQE